MLILNSKKSGSVEGELGAIHRIVTSLEPLNPHARRRVLRYALEFLSMEKPRAQKPEAKIEAGTNAERKEDLGESAIFTQ